MFRTTPGAWRRLIPWLLAALLAAVVLPVYAAAADDGPRDYAVALQRADSLRQLGLFQGTDTGYELERAPTRMEALVMLIRLLGQEEAALTGSWDHPFVDVPAWADAYAGYAWENGLAKGVSAELLDAASPCGSHQYLTFVLRALGYDDAAGDFSWDATWQLAVAAGLVTAAVELNDFQRADVVMVSYNALSACFKGSERMLAEQLVARGVFSAPELTAATGLVLLNPAAAEEDTTGPAETAEKTADEISGVASEETAEKVADEIAGEAADKTAEKIAGEVADEIAGKTAPTAAEKVAPAAADAGVVWLEYLSYGVNSPEELKEAWLDAVSRLPAEIIFSVPDAEIDHYIELLNQYSYLALSWSNGYNAQYGGGKIVVNPLYTRGGQTAAALGMEGYPADDYTRQLAAAATALYDEVIQPNMSEYERVKAVHDYIVDHTEYDNTLAASSEDIEGVLLYGRATCSGYAYTFKLLMDLCGIDCTVVGGTASNETQTGSHAWNKVCVDGEWYNIDVTWDDPVVRGPGAGPMLSYDYFLVSDRQISKDHFWNNDDFPACAKDWD